MSTALTSHAFHGDSLRTVVDDDATIWLVAADVARFLGYRMASDMLRTLDPDERGTRLVRTPGGEQPMAVLTEPGFYQASAQRQTGRITDPAAAQRVRAFQRWVTHDVLPSIRRTGSYTTAANTPEQRIALAVIEAQALLAEKDARIAVLEPPAAAWTALADSAGDYSMRDTAQILSRDPGIEVGQNRLAKLLRQIGWIDSRGIPYQHHVDVGRLRSKPQTRVSHRTGERVACDPQVRITLKGIEALHKTLHGAAPVQVEPAPLAVAS